MFSKDDDYYFITYNVLVFLNTIGCTSEKSKFTDYTKLVYIIPFVSDNSLLDILLKYNKLNRLPSKEEIDLLQENYIKSRLRLKLLTSILFTLENKNLIGLVKNNRRKSIDIWINKENIPPNFLKSALFKIEETNSKALKQEIPLIKSIATRTLIQHLFSSKGVRVWGEV
jgi:hypothetical protein